MRGFSTAVVVSGGMVALQKAGRLTGTKPQLPMTAASS